ncbi:unnamed protein product [Rotaria sordida]|uniref:PCI domain-containing protein n=1 Tax=Rotaria sordida TaxID=392033 RepID=A0A819YUD7_9BILA|nr:unnamed protein product [Rotaria sordida]CAF3940224.1 unnamed protein product [Rotaria sordida]CAF3968753.1 unnamed protein product [Rotaria sordida]CAF4154453.1 unnamed protein product [Rotaria sordida]
MNTQNFVGSTTAAGEDDNNNNNNLSLQRSNGSITIPSYEGNYHVDISSTNFELETITSSYTGLMRIYRLLYIAEHYSIRRGHDDLGDHYLDAGDFFNAVCCYVRSQYYCITPRHMMTMSSRLKVYADIAELTTKRHKLAARHFLSVSFEHCSNHFQDLISPQTLTQFVCLCRLATFERSEIHRLIIMSTNMKQYLELEPFICDILYKFNETSYSLCLALMSQFEHIFALDQYLASHLRTLYYEIRHRIIVIYFLPYKNASMTVMARQLNTTIDIFEDEFVHLIHLGKIKARIDSKNKILYVADTDQR